MNELVFSLDGELFYPDFDLVCDLAEQDNEITGIFIGESVPQNHRDFISGGCIIDQMLESAYEAVYDLSEGYLEDVTNDQIAELEDLIAKWMDENVNSPGFYTVKNIKTITYKAGDRDKIRFKLRDLE